MLLAMPGLPAGSARAQTDGVTFPETGKTVKGVFLEHWSYTGGTTAYGLPISDEIQETSPIDGKTYTMQYFERAVFEAHPDYQAPYNVLLSLLGTMAYNQKYPNGPPGQMASNSPDARFFPETGKHLGCQFLDYWLKNGGLVRLGYPISDELVETEADGSSVRVQYFERAVLKYDAVAIAHFDSEHSYIMTPNIGTFSYTQKYGDQAVSLPTPRPTTEAAGVCEPTPHGSSFSDQIDDPPVRASVGKGLVVTGTVKSSEGCKPLARLHEQACCALDGSEERQRR